MGFGFHSEVEMKRKGNESTDSFRYCLILLAMLILMWIRRTKWVLGRVDEKTSENPLALKREWQLFVSVFLAKGRGIDRLGDGGEGSYR
jgi:hypothetical protein